MVRVDVTFQKSKSIVRPRHEEVKVNIWRVSVICLGDRHDALNMAVALSRLLRTLCGDSGDGGGARGEQLPALGRNIMLCAEITGMECFCQVVSHTRLHARSMIRHPV
jgi:hypothetical protein